MLVLQGDVQMLAKQADSRFIDRRAKAEFVFGWWFSTVLATQRDAGR
jgi:hypothetical protein